MLVKQRVNTELFYLFLEYSLPWVKWNVKDSCEFAPWFFHKGFLGARLAVLR